MRVTGTIELDGSSVTLNQGGNSTAITAGSPAGDITITLPATSQTLATIAGTETLTNKTLTSPVISNPTFSGTATFVNITTSGNTTIGDADTDTLAINADLVTNIVPDVTNTYDLGTTAKRWRDLYVSRDGYIARTLLGDGTALLPSLSFESDSNTGLYRVTGDYIGFSTGYAAMATIGAKREGAENDSSLVFSPMLNENAVERMRITSGGSVGIGTTSPSSARADRTLHLYGSYPGLTIESTGVARKWNLTANYYDSTAALEVWDQTAGGVHTVFQAGGRVGIGLTNPAKKLDVYDSNGNATAQIKLRNSGTTAAAYLGAFSGHTYLSAGGTYDSGWTTDGTNGIANIVMETTNGGSAIAFGTAASNVAPTERMRILGGGDVGIGKTNPSYKLDVSGDIRATNELKSDYRLTLPGMTIGYWDTANNRIESGTRPLFITAYSQPIKFGPDGTETLRIETTGEIIHSYTNSFFTQRGGGGYSIMRLYGNSNAVELQMAAHQTSGMGSIGTYTSSALMFKTSNTERMRIMSGGGIGMGQSANSTPLRATLVKTGTTSVTFNMSLNTIGAWRPGFATVRVGAAQNGLQEHYAAWYILKITGYFGAGTSINILSSGGSTDLVSLSSSSDQNSPQAFSITVTDNGGTTNTMIADLDVAYHEGIISLT